MYVQTYTHILHVWLEWLKVHKRLLLGASFAILTIIHTGMVKEEVSDAYLLMRIKTLPNIQVYAPGKKRVIRRRRLAIATVSSASSSSSSSAISRKPFVPRGKSSSSRETLRRAAPDSEPSTSSGNTSSVPPISSIPSYSSPKDFPPFLRTVMPVTKVPNWGNMRTPDEWNRPYDEIDESEFVMVPAYDIDALTDETMKELLEHRDEPETIKTLTEKLTWSTRFFGAYDLDAGEFSAIHPGVDLKLAEGTPIGSIAGGKVNAVHTKNSGLGLHVIIEHRLPDGSQFFSIYGHLGEVSVSVGDSVKPGDVIGKIGMTGKTTAPHLHLQVDKGFGEEFHVANTPDHLPSRSEAGRFWVHPIEFIRTYAN